MRNFISILFICVAFGASAQSFTKVENKNAVKNKINSKAKSTSSIAANFKEVLYSSMFNMPKKGSGILRFKKDDKIRWEHKTPKKEIVLISGSKVRLYQDGKEVKSVTSNQVVKRVQSLMVQLFNGDFLNEKEFTVGYYQNTNTYKLYLKPKNARLARYIKTIEMYFGKKTLTLDKMVMVEKNSDKVVYSFSSVKLNGQIPDSNFTQF